MEKGFTLIELLAVIIILSIIVLITTVSLNKVINNSKDSISETQKKYIESAAESYYIKEGMNEQVTCVNLSTLIEKGYMDSSEIKDAKTKEILSGSVLITYESNQYSYQTDLCE